MSKESLDARLGNKLREGQGLMNNGIITDAGTGLDYFTGYAYQTLYDWDQYFETIAQFYFGWKPDYAVNGVRVFLANQDSDTGFIPRCIPVRLASEEGSEHVKPFLAQICCLVESYTNSIDWLTDDIFAGLSSYLIYWLNARDTSNIGLSIWNSAPHTGMDNQHERAGWWKGLFCAGVDLNCYLIRECEAMAYLALLREDFNAADSWMDMAEDRKAAINKELWDDKQGFFFDLDVRTGERTPVLSVGAFAALWAGVATDKQAKRMVSDHLTNPAEFWRTHPLPALAACEPGYTEDMLPKDLGCNWRAYTWIPTNYYTVKGLRRYGYNDIAQELENKTVSLICEAGLREWYTSDSGRGQGLDPFWGWSISGLFLPLEQQADFDPTAIPCDRAGWKRVALITDKILTGTNK